MYCAPLGVAYAARPDELAEAAPALSAITHWDERCRTACLAVTLAVAALVRGEEPRGAVLGAVGAVAGREGSEELELLVDTAGLDPADRRPRSGLRALHGGRRAADGGGGSDVRGRSSIRRRRSAATPTRTPPSTGALLGAHHGRDRLPESGCSKLAGHDELEAEATALAGFATR